MSHIRMFCGVLLFWIILIYAHPVYPDTPKPRLTVYPRVAIDSGVRVEAFIPKHINNRRMRIEIDGPLFRAFEEPMEGENAKAIYAITIDSLPEGEYLVTLGIMTSDGKIQTLRVSFCRGAGCFSEVPQ